MAGLHEIGLHEMVDGIRPRTSAAWNRGGTCGPAIGRNWGGDAAAAGHVAFRCRPHARARFRGEECQGGGAGDQFAGQLAAEKTLPVLVFVEDVAASGGYMIACAGDEIFCDPSSILGSIGVVGGSFGFQGLIQKIGVERRLYTAGAHKAMLDPFLPENPDDVARVKALQRDIHTVFIELVKQSRGERLKGTEDVLFTGEYWAGERSIALGLADAIGDLRSTLRARYGDKVQTPVIAPATGMLSGLLGRRSAGPGTLDQLDGIAGLPDELISALEARAIWAKFGL